MELKEEAIGRIGTVRDLPREVASGAGGPTHHASPLERPEEVLDDRQLWWLKPLGPAASVVARSMFALKGAIMRVLFRLRVEGLENVPEGGPFIIAPNHVSYLDSFVVAAVLPRGVLQRTYWAGWTGGGLREPADPSRQPPRAGGPRRPRPRRPLRPGLRAHGARARPEPGLVRRRRTFTDGKSAAVQARRGYAVGLLPGAGRARVHSWHVRGRAEGKVLAEVGEGHR